MSSWRIVCALTVVAGVMGASGMARAQAANEPGCTLEKEIYTCNWRAFVHRLEAAHTVSVETQSMDRFTARQLRELVGALGKTVAPEDQMGDLTFLLIPMQSTGVHIGPAGEPLATLRIYAPAPGNPRARLLWAETYTGQPDRPWAVTVHALIEQFQDRVQRH
jgi:hypothetical protein